MEKKLVDILICPMCKGDLERRKIGFFCPKCNRVYPFIQGIPDFRV